VAGNDSGSERERGKVPSRMNRHTRQAATWHCRMWLAAYMWWHNGFVSVCVYYIGTERYRAHTFVGVPTRPANK
jgi:hypothetical protein